MVRWRPGAGARRGLRRVLLAFGALASAPAHAACQDLLPVPAPVAGPTRLVTPRDIVTLRNIGTTDASWVPPESPLAVSPDGKRIAFVMTRADPSANRYCRVLMVMELRPGARPRVVDRGGDYMAITYPLRGFMVQPGAPDIVTPAWSPDGRSLAYRKRIAGRTEAWLADADGGGARSLARLEVDVDALAWSADGARLVLSSRPGFAVQQRAIAREGLSGFLYDDRFAPNDAARPALAAGEPRVLQSVAIATGTIAPASAADAARMAPAFLPGVPTALVASSSIGRRAWLAPETKSLLSPMRLHAEAPGGGSIVCSFARCAGSISALAWVGEAIVYLRREGWANGTWALYRWSPGTGAPRRILATQDAVHGCVPAGRQLVCLAENATTPPRIEIVNPGSGRRRALFDPNPEFHAIRLGKVRRLRIVNDIGLEAWADLVLPPGYQSGRIPLVIVQYHSDGFLRGGTGDDYPVHAFAARGMAVLSFERPKIVAALDRKVATPAELIAADTRGWADRRSILSALEVAIHEAVQLGVADPRRIGITGLSDGAETAVFALINTPIFAAAAISSEAIEPNTTMIYGGPRWAETLRAEGYPPLGRDDPGFWKPISLARNAARIDTPILMQVADREYLLSLEAWAALKQAGKPVELFVYPDEYHNKWQPAHRLATYERSLDWFDYWLAGRRDPDPAKAGQYRRWDALARLRAKAG